MVLYPRNETTFSHMFWLSLRHFFKTFCYALACILLLFLAVIFSDKFPTNHVVMHWVVKWLFIFVFFFFFSIALLATHLSFDNRKEGYFAAFKKIYTRLPAIIVTLIVYVLGIIAVLFAAHYIRIAVLRIDVNASQTITGLLLLIELVALAVFLCMFFFTYPICVIDEASLKKSFFDSAYLSEKNKIGIFLLLFIITLPYFLLIKQGLDFEWVARYHLSFLYVFLVLSFFVPLFINLLLLLINDSKQQIAEEA